MRFRALLLVAASLSLGAPADATTRYEFAGSLAEDLLSWPAGTSIAFSGLLTDPSLLPGEGAAASAIEIPELTVGGVEQTGVEAFVHLFPGSSHRFGIFVQFDGANAPDISIAIDLPVGDESAFPEIDFDLADPAVTLVAAEMNEDGVSAQPIDLGTFIGVVLPEPHAAAASIRYSWSGRVEPAVGAENPWELTGDGSAVTSTDGTVFFLEAFVDEAALDEDGSLNPDFAEFAVSEATLLIGGRKAVLDAPTMVFSDDAFAGLFDSVGFSTNAELLDTTLSFAAEVRLPATSFDLASPPAPDAPPLFAESPPIQFGGFGLPDLLTMPEDAPVTAVRVPWAAFPPASAVEWSSTTTGSAGDVGVTLSWLNEPSIPSTEFVDLSGLAFQAAPFYSLVSALEYASGSAWTVTFSEPVASLLLYTGFWRGNGGGADPVTYHFDVPFSIRSGLEEATVLGNSGGLILSLPDGAFHDGVVQVHGPLSSLTVTPDPGTASQQFMAMALVPLPPQVQPVDWTTPASGSAGEITVTMADLGATASLQSGDLSGSEFAVAPLSADQELLEYDPGADWTATLSEPVEGLLVYAKFWRGSDAGVAPVTYRFDSPFTILSGLREATISEDGTLLTLPAAGFHDGILFVPGPLASLSVEGDEPTDVAQTMTLAVVGAVPEPGGPAGALAAWLALLALRRRA